MSIKDIKKISDDGKTTLEELKEYKKIIILEETTIANHKYYFNKIHIYFKENVGSSIESKVILELEQIFTQLYNITFDDKKDIGFPNDLEKKLDELTIITNAMASKIKKEKETETDFFKNARNLKKLLKEITSKYLTSSSTITLAHWIMLSQ